MMGKILIIGISGVTCGGKTTLAKNLFSCIPNANILSQDDYFLEEADPRHTWIPNLNHINFDILSSLDMEKMDRDIKNIIKDKEIITIRPTNKINTISQSFEDLLNLLPERIIKMDNIEIFIIEGFSIFNYPSFQDIFSLKYYFTLSKEECFKRRQERDYEPPDCPGYFEECVWPEHQKQLREVVENMKNIHYFEDCSDMNSVLHQVLSDIVNLIDNSKLFS